MAVGLHRNSLGCLTVLLTTGLLILQQPSIVHAQVRDNREYCSSPAQLVLFLVDITTPYDHIDKNAIDAVVDEIFIVVRGGQRLIVRTIGESHTTSEKLIDRCIPHCPAAGLWERLIYCNDGEVRTDKEAVRFETTTALRSRLSQFRELQYSDIIRTLVAVGNEDVKGSQMAKIFVFSDLIENSDHLSATKLFTSPLEVLVASLRKHGLIAGLRDAQIRVAGVGRAGTLGKRPLTVTELQKLKAFWTAYLQASGAESIEIDQNLAR